SVSTEWAVQREVTPVILFLWIDAAYSRRLPTLMGIPEPMACWSKRLVFETGSERAGPSAGVPPGSEISPMLRLPVALTVVPTKSPSAHVGSSLSAPRGANGPPDPAAAMPLNPVTTIGPPPVTLDFRIT